MLQIIMLKNVAVVVEDIQGKWDTAVAEGMDNQEQLDVDLQEKGIHLLDWFHDRSTHNVAVAPEPQRMDCNQAEEVVERNTLVVAYSQEVLQRKD